MGTNITVEHNGETYDGQIMVIKSTHFGREDHGIATAYLHCEADSTGIGVGGFCLDSPVKDEDGRFRERVGTAYGLDHLLTIMRTVGVSRWEDLPGKHVVVLYAAGRGGWGGTSAGIASLTGERVMVLKEHAEEFAATHPEQVTA